jgi:hypothetical protein
MCSNDKKNSRYQLNFIFPKDANKNPNFWQNDAKFPNSRGIGHIPKIVKNSPVYFVSYNVTGACLCQHCLQVFAQIIEGVHMHN